jgi:hypothetical protein
MNSKYQSGRKAFKSAQNDKRRCHDDFTNRQTHQAQVAFPVAASFSSTVTRVMRCCMSIRAMNDMACYQRLVRDVSGGADAAGRYAVTDDSKCAAQRRSERKRDIHMRAQRCRPTQPWETRSLS